jgi:predicted ATPase
LLKTLPDTPERAQQELRLQTTLGAPLMATKGWAAPEVERVYTRARQLCQQLGETPQLLPVLWGLWAVYAVQGKLHTARELGEQCLHLAQRGHDPTLLPVAQAALGQTLYFLGEFGPARVHTEHGIRLYDPQQHRPQAFLYRGDPGVGCRGYAAWTLWSLGYPAQALKVANEALVLAQAQAHPENVAWALIGSAWLYQLRRDGQQTGEQAEAVVSLSTAQGFALQLGIGTILWGWALVEQGLAEEGLARMCQGLAACEAMEVETGRSHSLALLAEGYGKAGRSADGLTVLAEALEVVEKIDERFYQAELYRLKGELTLQSKVERLESSVTDPQARASNTLHPRRGGSRSMLSQSHCHCSPATSQVTRAARGDELEPVVAAARQEGGSPADAGGHLRLVHGGI